MKQNRILIIFLLSFLISCGVRKHVTTSVGEEMTTEELVEILRQDHQNDVQFMYTKISTKFKSNKYNHSFKTSLKLRRDSILWFRISFAGIPIYDGWVDHDSITVLDKVKKEFWLEDYKFLSSFVATKVDYYNFEELALGLPIEFDTSKQYIQLKDPNYYVLSTHSKKDIDRYHKGKQNDEEIMMRYFINPDSLKMHKIILDVPKDTATISISYPEFYYKEGNRIPKVSELYITTPSDTVTMILKYLKPKINEPKKFNLKIPETYKEID